MSREIRAFGWIEVDRSIRHDPWTTLQPLPPDHASMLARSARLWFVVGGWLVAGWLVGYLSTVVAVPAGVLLVAAMVLLPPWFRARTFQAVTVTLRGIGVGDESIPWTTIEALEAEPVFWREEEEATPQVEQAVVLSLTDGRHRALVFEDLPTSEQALTQLREARVAASLV